MSNKQELNKAALFEGQKIRRVLLDGEWWFSVVDVCGILTSQSDNLTARKYWNKLFQRLREEGDELVAICHQLKLIILDSKILSIKWIYKIYY